MQLCHIDTSHMDIAELDTYRCHNEIVQENELQLYTISPILLSRINRSLYKTPHEYNEVLATQIDAFHESQQQQASSSVQARMRARASLV